MKKAQISVTIEGSPAAARLPQAVALLEFLLNGRLDSRELPLALVSALLEISRLFKDESLPGLVDNYESWEQVETVCEVVAEQLRAARARQTLLGTNGSNGPQDGIEFDLYFLGKKIG